MQKFFKSNGEIIKFVNQLKDKITRTSHNIPSFLLKILFILKNIYFIIFPISLILNRSLATSSVPKQWKTSYIIPIYK